MLEFDASRREDGTVVIRFDGDRKGLRTMSEMFEQAAMHGSAIGGINGTPPAEIRILRTSL